MKLFKRYYLEAIGLFVYFYFYFLLPWALSQPSNITTTGGFVTLAIVVYFIVVELLYGIKQVIKYLKELE